MRVGERSHGRRQAVGLMAEQHADREARLPVEQIHRMHAGLDGGDLEVRFAQFADGDLGFPGMFPRDRVLGSKRRLRDHVLRRIAGDSGQMQLLNSRGIRRAKERAHVVKAADVFKQSPHGQGPDGFVRSGACGGAKRNPAVAR